MSDELIPSATAEIASSNDVARVLSLEPDPSVLSAIGRGHSLNSAIADLIDNSIDAGAERIGVRFMVQSGVVKSIRISDDGTGMNREQLTHAMTLGKRRNYGPGALGHFGMGLKGASLSQGACLLVFTNCGYEAIHGVRMYRDQARGKFEIDELTVAAAWGGYHRGSHRGIQSTGTVIEWTELDTVSVSSTPSIRQRWLDGVISELRGELGLTFHRLIDAGLLRVEIDEFDLEFDESGPPRTVEPVDPFNFTNSGRTGYPKSISAHLPGGGKLTAACHILPPNSQAPAARLLGKSRLDSQGIYVYRNDRLLSAGGWHSLLPSNRPDWQLARVSINVDDAMLRAIAINPEKRGVVFRPDFLQGIESAVADDETGFRHYLEEARQTIQAANVRRIGPKPVTALEMGLKGSTRDLVHEVLGSRSDTEPASIRWRVLGEERLFQFDYRRRTLWMNAGYRASLSGSDALALSIYLLIEKHFAKERPQQSTLDQIESWQRVLALTTLDEIGVQTFDPTIAEPDDADALPIFLDFAHTDSEEGRSSSHVPPSPADIGRLVKARLERDAGLDAEQEKLREIELQKRAVRQARDARRGELTDAGERMELIPHVAGASENLIDDLRRRLASYPLLGAEKEVMLAKTIEAGLFARDQFDSLARTEQFTAAGRELQQISADGVKAFDRFVASNLGLVFSLGARYVNRGLDFEDLVQEGAFGLIRAVQKFDFTQGFKFSTYATWWIRQALTRSLADRGSAIRIPVHMKDQQNKLRVSAQQFELKHGREPNLPEVAAVAQVSESDASRALSYVYSIISLDADSDREEGSGSLSNTITDESPAPVDLLISAEFRGSINRVLEGLDEREAATLRMRFGIGLQDDKTATLDEIGDLFGLTRERIRQIEKKAIVQLGSSPVIARQLQEYLDADLDRVGMSQLEAFTLAAHAPSVLKASGPREVLAAPREPTIDLEIRPVQPSAVENLIEAGSDAHIVGLYRQGVSLSGIEAASELDVRYIAERLCRIVLLLDGEIDDASLAPRHGLPWEPAERERVYRSYRTGTSVSKLAEHQGRTPLAIAWQLLDSPRRPVAVSKKVWRSVRGDRASRTRPPRPSAG